MAKEKVQYDEVIITLKNKDEQVWQYRSKQVSSLIGKTVYPSVEIEELKGRLESCIPLLEGQMKFYCMDGKWKKKKSKPEKKKKKKK